MLIHYIEYTEVSMFNFFKFYIILYFTYIIFVIVSSDNDQVEEADLPEKHTDKSEDLDGFETAEIVNGSQTGWY